jgi:hypothetical protein
MEEIEKLDSNSFHVDNTLIIPFLRKLITDLENNEIYPTTRKLLGEFYMDISFIETFKIDTMTNYLNSTVENNEDGRDDEGDGDNEEETIKQPSENDMSKFLVLGWYIYTHIINGNKDNLDNLDNLDNDTTNNLDNNIDVDNTNTIEDVD